MKLFISAFSYSILALLLTFLVIPNSFGIASIFIVAFFAYENITEFLRINKEQIIIKKQNPKIENIKTFKSIFILFLWIALAYLPLFLIFDSPNSQNYLYEIFSSLLINENLLKSINSEQVVWFVEVMIPNLSLLIIWIIFSFFYYNYSIALFVTWGATYIWLSTGFMIEIWNNLLNNLIKFFFVIIPLSSVIISLIICSTSMYFLRKGMKNYYFIDKRSKNDILTFNSIIKTVIILIIVAVGINLFGTVRESIILPYFS